MSKYYRSVHGQEEDIALTSLLKPTSPTMRCLLKGKDPYLTPPDSAPPSPEESLEILNAAVAAHEAPDGERDETPDVGGGEVGKKLDKTATVMARVVDMETQTPLILNHDGFDKEQHKTQRQQPASEQAAAPTTEDRKASSAADAPSSEPERGRAEAPGFASSESPAATGRAASILESQPAVVISASQFSDSPSSGAAASVSSSRPDSEVPGRCDSEAPELGAAPESVVASVSSDKSDPLRSGNSVTAAPLPAEESLREIRRRPPPPPALPPSLQDDLSGRPEPDEASSKLNAIKECVAPPSLTDGYTGPSRIIISSGKMPRASLPMNAARTSEPILQDGTLDAARNVARAVSLERRRTIGNDVTATGTRSSENRRRHYVSDHYRAQKHSQIVSSTASLLSAGAPGRPSSLLSVNEQPAAPHNDAHLDDDCSQDAVSLRSIQSRMEASDDRPRKGSMPGYSSVSLPQHSLRRRCEKGRRSLAGPVKRNRKFKGISEESLEDDFAGLLAESHGSQNEAAAELQLPSWWYTSSMTRAGNTDSGTPTQKQ